MLFLYRQLLYFLFAFLFMLPSTLFAFQIFNEFLVVIL